MSRRLALVLAVGLAASPMPLAAQDAASVVVDARQAGLIGERYDGYMGVIRPLSPTQRKRVAETNIVRRNLYTGLARKRGVSPQEVGITVACQLFREVEVGDFYLLRDGQWRRRSPGQAAPRPDYCG